MGSGEKQPCWVEIANPEGFEIPPEADFHYWVGATLRHHDPTRWRTPCGEAPVSLKVVSASESQLLNRTYRGKDAPTNVLSFPADFPPEMEWPLLGDLAICAEVVVREATEQNKPLNHHWAHLVVHGVLHLLGYDHAEAAEAQRMESLEVIILADMGITNPYISSC